MSRNSASVSPCVLFRGNRPPTIKELVVVAYAESAGLSTINLIVVVGRYTGASVKRLVLRAFLPARAVALAPARPPLADEWGYRPADSSTVTLNPPSLTWVHETGAARYTVEWARKTDFSDAVAVTNLPWT